MATCRDVMTPDPTCCYATDPVSSAARIMRDENVGSVPIVSDPQRRGLVGIVTDRDLTLRVIAEGRDPSTTSIQNVMTVDPVSCRPDDDINETLRLMSRNQIRRIPVVDENNTIVGIIAQADVAVRLDQPNKVGEVVEQISLPTTDENAVS